MADDILEESGESSEESISSTEEIIENETEEILEFFEDNIDNEEILEENTESPENINNIGELDLITATSELDPLSEDINALEDILEDDNIVTVQDDSSNDFSEDLEINIEDAINYDTDQFTEQDTPIDNTEPQELEDSLSQNLEDEEKIITQFEEEEASRELDSSIVTDSTSFVDDSSVGDQELPDGATPIPSFVSNKFYKYYDWKNRFIETNDKFYGYFLNNQLNTYSAWKNFLIEVDLSEVEVVNPFVTFAIGTSIIDIPIDEGTSTIIEVECIRNIGYCRQYSALAETNNEEFWNIPFELMKTYAVFDNLQDSLDNPNPSEIGVSIVDIPLIRSLDGYIDDISPNANTLSNLNLIPIRIWFCAEV